MGMFDGVNMIMATSKSKPSGEAEHTLKEFLRSVEGYDSSAYDDTSGYSTAGYGHKMLKGESAQGMTRGIAESIMDSDIIKATKAYDKLVTTNLNENQRAAVISLIYNVGAGSFKESTARENLNKGDIPGFLWEAFDKKQGFVKGLNPKTGKKEPVEGLVNRREAELKLFTTPENNGGVLKQY